MLGYVYILGNFGKTVLYTGVTSDVKARIASHQSNEDPNSFTSRYRCHFLLYLEEFSSIELAIAREKQIKGGKRQKKLDLIRQTNPTLAFLSL
jgi:putative endonuclease